MNSESISDQTISGDIFNHHSEAPKKIRVGVMLDSCLLPAWYYTILNSIIRSDYASVDLVILNKSREKKITFLNKILADRKNLLYLTYAELENRIVHHEQDASARINSRELLRHIPFIEIQPGTDTVSDCIGEEDTERIRKFRLDVILKIGFGLLKGDILNASKYGLWSYSPADTTIIRGGPPGFYETFEERGVRGAIIQILTGDSEYGTAIYRSSFRCDSLFVNRNNNNCYLTSSMFIPRLLKKLYQGGEDTFRRIIEQENQVLSFYNEQLYTAPSNLNFLRLFLQHSSRKGLEILRCQFVQQQWFLMYDLRDQISTSFWRFKKIMPPKDRFWADPHIFFKDDTYYIFIEEYIFKKKRGHISLIEMERSGICSDPIMVLDEPFHMSYPNVFDYNGVLYMIPETYQTRSINLYQCTDFPMKWKHKATLMDSVKAVDSTIAYHKNKWWLFTNISEPEGTFNSNELFVFHSDDLFGHNWTSHPMNPVISDIKRARSAGKIFEINGILYRPSQCCVPTYGYGIKLNEIVTLTRDDYSEKEIAFIEPNWDKNLKGVHTFGHENRLTMIDGLQ